MRDFDKELTAQLKGLQSQLDRYERAKVAIQQGTMRGQSGSTAAEKHRAIYGESYTDLDTGETARSPGLRDRARSQAKRRAAAIGALWKEWADDGITQLRAAERSSSKELNWSELEARVREYAGDLSRATTDQAAAMLRKVSQSKDQVKHRAFRTALSGYKPKGGFGQEREANLLRVQAAMLPRESKGESDAQAQIEAAKRGLKNITASLEASSSLLWGGTLFKRAPLAASFDKSAGLDQPEISEARLSSLIPEWGGEAADGPTLDSPSASALRRKALLG